MNVQINRTGEKLYLKKKNDNYRSADSILSEAGYNSINCLDIENRQEIQWKGIEYNRLFAKDNILYRFNEWITFGKDIPQYPYNGIEIEEIGTIF